MIPGWRPPPGPGSPGVRRHPADSPAIPEPASPSPAASGRPGRAPVHPLRRDPRSAPRHGDGPRAAGTTDGDASAPRQIQEDPVGGRTGCSPRRAPMHKHTVGQSHAGAHHGSGKLRHARLIIARRSRRRYLEPEFWVVFAVSAAGVLCAFPAWWTRYPWTVSPARPRLVQIPCRCCF